MSNKYIKNEIKRIINIITESSYSKQYFLYKSQNKLLSKSYSEDDWNYCLLILRFVNPKDSIKIIGKILESFLSIDRYRDKFDQHFGYLHTTIAKVILSSSQSEILGCLYSKYLDQNPQSKFEDFDSNCLVASCKIEDVLKISNFLSIFSLDKSSYSSSFLNHEFNYSSDSTNFVKISMFGGLLNHFDLMVFLNILYAYKSFTTSPSDNIVDISFSTISFMLFDNGRNRRKYINSLNKLFQVHLQSWSSSKKSSLEALNSGLNSFYSLIMIFLYLNKFFEF
uniref:hypothetical protein n=1 Tax=Gracilaria usneoides TaxID=172951 RepID=UPI001D101AD7|nr:hypothetical protein LK225_pgp144 [Crassiphycus usneoides]UAD88601.1 hypothetical protein [Crassiphycus usneoides]